MNGSALPVASAVQHGISASAAGGFLATGRPAGEDCPGSGQARVSGSPHVVVIEHERTNWNHPGLVGNDLEVTTACSAVEALESPAAVHATVSAFVRLQVSLSEIGGQTDLETKAVGDENLFEARAVVGGTGLHQLVLDQVQL